MLAAGPGNMVVVLGVKDHLGVHDPPRGLIRRIRRGGVMLGPGGPSSGAGGTT